MPRARYTVPILPSSGLNNNGLHTRTPEDSVWLADGAEVDLSGRFVKRRGLKQWGNTIKEPALDGLRYSELFNDLGHFTFPAGTSTANTSITASNSRLVLQATGTGAGTDALEAVRVAQANDGTADNAAQMSYRFMVRTKGALPGSISGTANDYCPTIAVRDGSGNIAVVALSADGICVFGGGLWGVVSGTDIDDSRWHVVELRWASPNIQIYVDDVFKVNAAAGNPGGFTTANNQVTFKLKTNPSVLYTIEYDLVQARSKIADPFTASKITNLVDWRSSSPIEKHLMACAGSLIYVDSGHAGAWLGLDYTSPGGLTNFIPFLDNVIIANYNQQPRRWPGVGSPVQLGALTPRFNIGAEHKGRLFVAGVEGFPLRVYFSGANNLDDWTTETGGTFTTSGYLDIPDRKGASVTAILGNFYGDLIVWTTTSVWRVTGAFVALVAPDGPDYGLVNINTTVGTDGPRSIERISNDAWFLSQDGVHTLATTQNYGDLTESSASAAIRNRWKADTNSDLPRVSPNFLSVMKHIPEEDRTYVGVQLRGDAGVDHALVFNHSTGQWSGPIEIPGGCMEYVRLSYPELPCLMVGSDSGQVGMLTSDNKSDYLSGAYDYQLRSSKLDGRSQDPALAQALKTWAELRIWVLPRTNHVFTIGWGTDEDPVLPEAPARREVNVTQNQAEWSDLDGNFVLDESRLADSESLVLITLPLDIPGRWLQFYIKQNNASQDAIILGAAVDFTVDRIVKENA